MHAYYIDSIKKSPTLPHVDARAGSWYRYVISDGVRTINGYRSGRLAEVRSYLNEVIKRLNSDINIRSPRHNVRRPMPRPCYATESYASAP